MARASRLRALAAVVTGLVSPVPAEELPPVTVWGSALPADAPPAATVVPGEEIDALGIGGVRDLGALAPSFIVSPAGDRKSSFLGMRGLSNATLGETSVGVYVDGIPYIVNGLGGYERYGFNEALPESQIRFSEDHGAMLVTATRDSIRYEFWTIDRQLVDRYEVRKSCR